MKSVWVIVHGSSRCPIFRTCRRVLTSLEHVLVYDSPEKYSPDLGDDAQKFGLPLPPCHHHPIRVLAVSKGQYYIIRLYARSQHSANAILIASREADDDDEFRLFKKQLYRASLAKVFELLREGMTTPQVDTHYCRVIFRLDPFIADYPEKVMLSGIVQGWCPKYVPPHAIRYASVRY